MKLLSLLVLFVILFGGYYVVEILPQVPVKSQDFIVNRGDRVGDISRKLGVDVNSTAFKLYARLFLKDFTLQAGTYSISKDTTLELLFSKTLKNPTSKDITITILPGWNIWDIDAYLAKEGIIKSQEFTTSAENISDVARKSFPFLGKTKTLEGFLMPDTYRISPEAWADAIIKILLQTFDERVYKEFNFASTNELYETLIFASILEKEEKSSINKPIVAGILKKRYVEKMPIGADATVCYAYKLTMTDCTPEFIAEHIYEKTSYNTRNSLSLPPTPIANPSIDTIRATIESEASKYYYYLHDMDGNIHYGKTLEDHNRNRVQYLGK